MLLLGAAMTGCILITPLDDYEAAPTPSESGGAAGAQSGGGSTAQGGNLPNGGSSMDGGAGAGGSAGAEGGAPGECIVNADCVSELGPARCRPSDRSCVLLNQGGCFFSVGDETDDDAVFLGAFVDMYPADPRKSKGAYPIRLVVDELDDPASEFDRVPGLNGAQLVVTVCDNSEENFAAGMQHLVDEVEVPAVLATLKPADLATAFTEHPDVLYLSPIGRTQAVTDADDASDPETRLIWNMLGQPTDYTDSYVRLIQRVDDYVRHRSDRAATDPLRLALVIDTTDASNSELGEALHQNLEWNGKSVSQNETDNNFQLLEMTRDTSVEEAVTTLEAFVPDIVVSAAGTQFTKSQGVLETLENLWGSDVRPFYVLSPYNVTDLGATLDTMNVSRGIGEQDANSRFIGLSVAPPSNTDPQGAYEAALRAHFPGSMERFEPDTGNYYDAMYFLAYAAYGADRDQPLSGRSMAAALERLFQGTRYYVGPDYVKDVFEVLDDGGTVELNGTLGPPDFFDGYRRVNGAVYCFEFVSEAALPRMGVLIYNTATDDFQLDMDRWSEFPCFSGFF
ncbi:MAG TPA: hypothetical protein VF103_16060 [Polyangiaceae bacterium]